MEKITILAKSSSSDEPYSVDFLLKEGSLSIHCSCRAGEYGQLCKHKLALTSNDASMQYDGGQADKLDQVAEWVQKTGFAEMIHEIQSLEKEAEEIKKRLKASKSKLARLMRDGVA